LLEVFYGSRPFDALTDVRPTPNGPAKPSLRFLPESGARLHFVRADSGLITCLLIPAVTEAHRAREDSMLLEEFLEPTKLRKRATAHWRALMSYMQCTCLEGEPTLFDRLRVFLLRSFKRLVCEGRSQDRRVSTGTRAIVKFAFTVGLAGFILTVYERCSSGPDKSLAAIASLNEGNRLIQGELTAYKDLHTAEASKVDKLEQQVAEDREALRALRHELDQQQRRARPRKPPELNGR
jgi:hypothetical protein